MEQFESWQMLAVASFNGCAIFFEQSGALKLGETSAVSLPNIFILLADCTEMTTSFVRVIYVTNYMATLYIM